jgi:hypothetical protein
MQIHWYMYVIVSVKKIHTIQARYRQNTFHRETHTYTFIQIHTHSEMYVLHTDMYVCNTNLFVCGMYLYVSFTTFSKINQFVFCMYVPKDILTNVCMCPKIYLQIQTWRFPDAERADSEPALECLCWRISGASRSCNAAACRRRPDRVPADRCATVPVSGSDPQAARGPSVTHEDTGAPGLANALGPEWVRWYRSHWQGNHEHRDN